jgi:hypothetical protein
VKIWNLICITLQADLCVPRLNEGDQVVLINGRDIAEHTHDQVVLFIKASCERHSGELVLLVRPNGKYFMWHLVSVITCYCLLLDTVARVGIWKYMLMSVSCLKHSGFHSHLEKYPNSWFLYLPLSLALFYSTLAFILLLKCNLMYSTVWACCSLCPKLFLHDLCPHFIQVSTKMPFSERLSLLTLAKIASLFHQLLQ